VFRADGHHSKPEVLAWLQREGLRYVIGYAPNAVLKRQFSQCISAAGKRYERHIEKSHSEVEAHTIASSSYSAGSWKGKAAAHHLPYHRRSYRVDERFAVTNIEEIGAKKLFKLAARVRVMKTRVEMHLAAKHPGSSLVA